MTEVGSPIRKFLENVEVAEDLTDSMLEEEHAQAMAQLHESDHVDDSGHMLDDSGYSSVSSSAAADDQKSSVAASVYDSIVDTLEKILPIDEFDDFEDDESSDASEMSQDLPELPKPPALHREISIENIEAISGVKALPEVEQDTRTREADVTPPEMGVEENEFIAAIEGAILKEFGGASYDSASEPNDAAATERMKNVNDANIQSAGNDKIESEVQSPAVKMSKARKQAEKKNSKPRSSRGIFATRRSKLAGDKSRYAKTKRTDSRLAQKYSSSSRMKDTSPPLTAEALKQLDVEAKEKKVCFDEKTDSREKSTPKNSQNNEEMVESDDQYSSGSSDTDFDSDTETEVETEIGKDLLDAFIDFLMFQGRPKHEDEEKPKRERSRSKTRRVSRRRKKEKGDTKEDLKALGVVASLDDDDEESCQYESLINIPGVRSSDSFDAGADESPVKRKPSGEDDAKEVPNRDKNNGTPGGLQFDASFFEELWKEAVVTLKKTKLFESTPQKPTTRSDSLPRMNVRSEQTSKEDIEATYRPLVDDLLQDVPVGEEDPILSFSASAPSSEYLDKVAQASNPLEVPSPKTTAERMAKADLTLNHFKTKYPNLSEKLDPAKLDSIVKAQNSVDEVVKEIYSSGKDLNDEEVLHPTQRADMNVEVVREVNTTPIAIYDSSFMRDLHESNVVSKEDRKMEGSVEYSLDDHRNVFSVLSEIGVTGVSGSPLKSIPREMRMRKHCDADSDWHVHKNWQGKSDQLLLDRCVELPLGDHSGSKNTTLEQEQTFAPIAVKNKSPLYSIGALRKAKRTTPARSRSASAIRPVPQNVALAEAKNAHALAGNSWQAKSQRKSSATKPAPKKQEKKTSPPLGSTMLQSTESTVLQKDSEVVDKYSRRHGILGLIQNRSKSSPRSAQVDPAESKATGNRPKSPWARRGRKESVAKLPQTSSAESISDVKHKKETEKKVDLPLDPVPKKSWARRRTTSASSKSKSTKDTSHVSDEVPPSKITSTSSGNRDSEGLPRGQISAVGNVEGANKNRSMRENSDAVKMVQLNCTDTSHSSEEETPQTPDTPRTESRVGWQGFPPVDGFQKARSREPRLLLRIRSVNPFGRRQSSTMPKQASNPRPREQSTPCEQVMEWDDFPEIDFNKSASAPADSFENRKDDVNLPSRASDRANLYTEGEFDFDMFEHSSTPISN